MGNNSNIDIVRSIYRNFLAGNLDEVLAAFDEKIDWDSRVDWRGGPEIRAYEGRWIGREQLAEAFRAFLKHVRYERAAGDMTEYVASGNSVLVTGRDIRRVNATGALTENRWSMFWTLDRGKVIRFRGYQHTVDATEPATEPAKEKLPIDPG